MNALSTTLARQAMPLIAGSISLEEPVVADIAEILTDVTSTIYTAICSLTRIPHGNLDVDGIRDILRHVHTDLGNLAGTPTTTLVDTKQRARPVLNVITEPVAKFW